MKPIPQRNLFVWAILLFILLFYVYYEVSFDQDVDGIFLTITTFLFAIISGFFIARQGTRYSAVRRAVAEFDGNIASLYKLSLYLGSDVSTKIRAVLQESYKKIVDNSQWDFHFAQKTSALSELHNVIRSDVMDGDLTKQEGLILHRMFAALFNAQMTRKTLIALRGEYVSKFQWLLIAILALILIVLISTLESQGGVFASVIKSASVLSVISITIIIRQLETMVLATGEGIVGEKGAQDLLGIVEE